MECALPLSAVCYSATTMRKVNKLTTRVCPAHNQHQTTLLAMLKLIGRLDEVSNRGETTIQRVERTLGGGLCLSSQRPHLDRDPPWKENGTRNRDPQKEHRTRQPDRMWHHTETPPPLLRTEWHMLLKILPCPKHRLRAVIITMKLQQDKMSLVRVRTIENPFLFYQTMG